MKEWKSIELGYEKFDVTSINMNNLIEGRTYLYAFKLPISFGGIFRV
jgi:putative uncharacterized protein (fragment)